ncbi:MAG TPA: hypothetical protein VLB46_11405 [Pyrinomonadaceae bacterium]|nr:hypothetical protein [Pyrinomonadaceae bacterium]
MFTCVMLTIIVILAAVYFGFFGGKKKPKEFPDRIVSIVSEQPNGYLDAMLKKLALDAETAYAESKQRAIDAEKMVLICQLGAKGVFETQEQRLAIDKLAIQAQFARALVSAKNATPLQEAADRALLASDNHLSVLTEGAAALLVTVEDLSLINRTRLLEEAKNATDYERALNEIRASFIYEQEPKQLLHLQKDAIFGLYGERARLRDSDDPARDDKLRLLNRFINAEEKDFYDKTGADRLFQTEAQEDPERSDENPKPRRNGGQGLLPA